MSNELLDSLGQMCSLASAQAVTTMYQFVWKVIVFLWPWYWLLIILFLAAWVTYEILTRNGSAHYNSENGFSPLFNSFVGSGTYAGLQALLFFSLTLIFGAWIYCFVWPIAVHIIVFKSTGYLLHYSGFWPRLEKPNQRRKRRRRRRY